MSLRTRVRLPRLSSSAELPTHGYSPGACSVPPATFPSRTSMSQ